MYTDHALSLKFAYCTSSTCTPILSSCCATLCYSPSCSGAERSLLYLLCSLKLEICILHQCNLQINLKLLLCYAVLLPFLQWH